MSRAGEREKEELAFQNICFDSEKPNKSLDDLKEAALGRIDAEIYWYQKHAGLRKIPSYTIRLLAMSLAAISAMLVTVSTFVQKQAVLTSENTLNIKNIDSDLGLLMQAFNIDPINVPLYSVSYLLIAGFMLAVDQRFLITKGMTRLRRAEYSLRVKRAEFAADFSIQRKHMDLIDDKVFRVLKAMSEQAFANIINDVKNETENWADAVDASLEALIKDIAKQDEATKSRAQTMMEEVEKVSAYTKLYPLKILLEEKQSRGQGPFRFVILGIIQLDMNGKLVVGEDGKTPVRNEYELRDVEFDELRTIMVPPGVYEVSALKDVQNISKPKVITSNSAEVSADSSKAVPVLKL